MEITKESLISGVLTMFRMGALSEDLVLHQIKQFATDERIDWASGEDKTKYSPVEEEERIALDEEQIKHREEEEY